MDFLVGMAYGALGGAILGLKGYIEVAHEGMAFDWMIFGKSMVLPIIVGAFAGIYMTTPADALFAGFLGKMVQEIANTYNAVPKVIKI